MEEYEVTREQTETTIATNKIFSGKVISLQVDTVLLPDGTEATRELVKHPGAAAVIALVDQKLVVVEQYRKPLEKMQIEIPAGKLDPGEDAQTAAARELEEETGYIATELQLYRVFATSPGFADEWIHLYIAKDVTSGQQQLDEDEFLNVFTITLEEAEAYIANGRIGDAKTLLAVLAWKQYLATGKWQ
ncbi:NUDIX hydrolase [Paenibacillus yanchengensis]|uniref:NUDIX hydrolase n=1 Tax=Paenibacillus yanchengensis TaxID=2035833 RepID=A0ABW4YK21_9BACL